MHPQRLQSLRQHFLACLGHGPSSRQMLQAMAMSYGMMPITDEVESVMLMLEQESIAEYMRKLDIWRLSDRHAFEEPAPWEPTKNNPKKPSGDDLAKSWNEKYPAGSTSSATPVSR